MAMVVTYFYSGAIVGTMLKGGIRDAKHFDGSIVVGPDISVDDVIYEIKKSECRDNPKLAHIRQLNRI